MSKKGQCRWRSRLDAIEEVLAIVAESLPEEWTVTGIYTSDDDEDGCSLRIDMAWRRNTEAPQIL